MQTLEQTYERTYTPAANSSVIRKFINWCKGQEEYRFGWLAAIIAIHGCILTPLTLLTIFLSGVNLVLLMTAMAAMGMTLVTNLSAMPTKITIPVFFASVLIDCGIIAISISNLM